MNAESQFNCCPFIWIFHSRTLNKRINRLHEKALRLVYKYSNLLFEELLRISNSEFAILGICKNLKYKSFPFSIEFYLPPEEFSLQLAEQEYFSITQHTDSFQRHGNNVISRTQNMGINTKSLYAGYADIMSVCFYHCLFSFRLCKVLVLSKHLNCHV